jgi:hypothetical protein
MANVVICKWQKKYRTVAVNIFKLKNKKQIRQVLVVVAAVVW